MLHSSSKHTPPAFHVLGVLRHQVGVELRGADHDENVVDLAIQAS